MLEDLPTTAIKVYATCLRPHLSYKTVVITPHTTSKQVILGLLSRFRMRHRDPNLFHLTMEVTVELGARQTILLEDNSRPAEMISCNPWAQSKFILQAKQGGLVRVYDHLVRPESVYKCLIISEETTVGDTIGILRSCYRDEEVGGLGALQRWEGGEEQERQLGEQEQPLVVMAGWGQESRRFLLRREGLERGLGYRNSCLRQTIRRNRRGVEGVEDRQEVQERLEVLEVQTDSDGGETTDRSSIGSRSSEGRSNSPESSVDSSYMGSRIREERSDLSERFVDYSSLGSGREEGRRTQSQSSMDSSSVETSYILSEGSGSIGRRTQSEISEGRRAKEETSTLLESSVDRLLHEGGCCSIYITEEGTESFFT
jgi:hypothetical protein